MLKNKLKIIALLTVIILSLMIPIVRAENETVDQTTENQVMPINEESGANSSAETLIQPRAEDNNFKKGDVYLAGDDITIDYIVDGNLFVVAETVTINSQIGGDAFICAGTINVGEQGYIFSNLFACAESLNISGVVYDVYAIANNITIDGYIYRDIRVGTNSLNLNGTVGRNAFVDSNEINFAQLTEEEIILSSQGIINGDLNYTSSKEASIPEGAVAGTTNFTEKTVTVASTSIQDYILELGIFVATVAIIWLLCLWLKPNFLVKSNELLARRWLPILLIVVFAPILIILLCVIFVILLILEITSKIALICLGLFLLLLAISSSIAVISINNIICNKLKTEKTIVKFGTLVASSIVIWLLTIIPYVGGLISFVLTMFGLGIIIISIIPSKTSKKEEKTVINTEN